MRISEENHFVMWKTPLHESYHHILMCLLYKPVFPYVSFSTAGIPPVF